MNADKADIINQITHGTAIGVTDGSFYEEEMVGAAAWTITNGNHEKLLESTTIVPGYDKQHSSIRSELCGLLAILDYIHSICEEYNLSTGGITLYCDNINAVNIINEWTLLKMTPRHKNADIVSACLAIKGNLTIKIQCCHIYGHQDRNIPYHLLTPTARLNIDMDKNAKSLAKEIIHSNDMKLEAGNHPLAFITCYWNQIPIADEINNKLYEIITNHKVISYWTDKGRVNQHTLPLIDMKAMSKSLQPLSLNLRRFITKWSCECLATGKNMQRWKMRHLGHCPFCNEPNEDTLHIMQCKHSDSFLHFDDAIKDLIKKLFKLDTCSYLLKALRNELYAWRNHQSLPNIDNYPTLLQQTIHQQRQIGWKQFMEGLITQSWGLYMSRYYKSRQMQKTGNKWATRLIKYVWEATFVIWETRNAQLHQTERIHELEGVSILKQTITNEWKQGLGRLPTSDYSHYFTITIEALMEKSIEYLKSWLMIVRQARVMMDPSHLIHDEFAESIALQQWIGISYEITDDEARPTLEQAAELEWRQGIDELDTNIFEENFNITINNLLKLSTTNLTEWFVVVRNGRINSQSKNIIQDEFTYSGALKSWAGLE